VNSEAAVGNLLEEAKGIIGDQQLGIMNIKYFSSG